MKRIAITSSMGSEKTFIAMKFASLGVPVLIMDQVVKQLQITNESLIKKIKKRFPDSYTGNVMNKEYMVRKLFYDDSGKNLKDISEIIKPYLKEELDKFYDQFKNKRYVLIESALVYEYNLQDQFDEVIFVNADPKKRKQMAMTAVMTITILLNQIFNRIIPNTCFLTGQFTGFTAEKPLPISKTKLLPKMYIRRTVLLQRAES